VRKSDLYPLGEKVNFQSLRQYLTAHSWQSLPSKRETVGIYRSPNAETDVLVPLDRGFADYGEAMVTAAERISTVEGRSLEAVLNDLRLPSVDTLRFARGDAADGTLSLEDGAGLVAAARKCILASACSVERPSERYHRRMSLKAAEAYMRECRLGQTEAGSFVLTILCPVQQRPNDPLKAPFGRRATEKLIGSVRGLVDSLRRDTEEVLFDEAREPIVTANLCDALVEMMPSDERSDVILGATWSTFYPSSAPNRVQIDRDLFERVEDVAQRLRPKDQEQVALFLGRVLELSGADNARGQLEGEVTLSLMIEEDLVRARCNLGPADYQLAGTAHLNQRPISIKGVLRRRPRSSFLEQPSELKILDQ